MKEEYCRSHPLHGGPYLQGAAAVDEKDLAVIHRISGTVYGILTITAGSDQQSDRSRELRAFIGLLQRFGKKEMVGEDRRRDLIPDIERFWQTLQEHDRNISKFIHTPYAMLLRPFAVLFVVPLLIAFLPAHGQLTRREIRITEDLTRWLTDDLKKDGMHGSISVAIVRKGQVIWANAFGYSAPDEDSLADTGTIYRQCSITKTFTATILLQLVQEGKVGLDDPADKYIPELRDLQGYSGQYRFTLRQLASHTSGLAREPTMKGANTGPVKQWENKLLACIPLTSFFGLPGYQFQYSNIGFALLGLALERATDVPFIQLVQDRILTPLHMDNTFFAVPDDKRHHLAHGIENRTDGKIDTRFPMVQIAGMGYHVPSAGIWSTPSDLAKFLIALTQTGMLLQPESLRAMLAVPIGGRNYGLGIMILQNSRQWPMTLIGHNGRDPGYTSQYAINPRNGDMIILMRNYDKGITDLEAVARLIIEKL